MFTHSLAHCKTAPCRTSSKLANRSLLSKLSLASPILLTLAAGWTSTPAMADPPDEHWAAGRILVQPRPGLSEDELDKILQQHHGKRAQKIEQINLHVVEVPPTAEAAVAEALSHNPHIKFAELDMEITPADAVTPNDPKYSSQWHLPKIQAPTAWGLEPTLGQGIVIAILDTGVDGTHPDLAGQMVPGWNSYDNNSSTIDVYGHGTKVAGTTAATSYNGIGVASVAGQASIMPVRISDPTGYAYWSTVAQGLTWAADHGAQVANISYDGVSGSSTVQSAAQYMRNKGGVVVVAAGNSGGLESIAASSTLISVAATDSNDARASFSSYGTYVDLAAPGVGIWTTTNGGGYGSVSGTSFSSPIVAGVVALMKKVNPALTPADIDSILAKTADDRGDPGWDQYYGYGRVNAANAVLMASQTIASDTTPPAVSITSPTGGTVKGLIPVDVNATDNVGVAHVDLYANGKLVASDSLAPYSFSWDTTASPEGPLTLTAYAYDAAGNQAVSKGVSVTVDNVPDPVDTQPPTVTITSPANGATVNGNVTIAITAADNVGVTQLSCSVDGQVLGTASSGSLNCNWNARKATSGNHTISAQAKDAAGNTTSTSITVKR